MNRVVGSGWPGGSVTVTLQDKAGRVGKGRLRAPYLSWESRALRPSRLFLQQWRTEQTVASECLGWRESQVSENQQTQASAAFCLAAGTCLHRAPHRRLGRS